jgi:PPOX class probable F420-dependent enzyme
VKVERARVPPPELYAEVRQASLEERDIRHPAGEAIELLGPPESGPHDDRLEAVGVPGDRDRAVGLEHRPHGRSSPGGAPWSPRPRHDWHAIRAGGPASILFGVFEERPHITTRLRDETVVWLTTVNAVGQPQSSPVWFLAEPEHLVVYSLADTPRIRNIVANPRVCLNLNSSASGDDLVIIEGRAEIVADPVPADQDDDYLAKYDAAIVREGMTAEGFARDYPVRIHVHPTRLRAS